MRRQNLSKVYKDLNKVYQDLSAEQFNDLFDQLTNIAMYYDEYEIAINMRKAQIGMKCLFDDLDEDSLRIKWKGDDND